MAKCCCCLLCLVVPACNHVGEPQQCRGCVVRLKLPMRLINHICQLVEAQGRLNRQQQPIRCLLLLQLLLSAALLGLPVGGLPLLVLLLLYARLQSLPLLLRLLLLLLADDLKLSLLLLFNLNFCHSLKTRHPEFRSDKQMVCSLYLLWQSEPNRK